MMNKGPANAAQKKQAAAKGGKPPAALPEITDNRPHYIKYECDVAESNGGEGLNVTEELAIKFANTSLLIELYETNRETLEE